MRLAGSSSTQDGLWFQEKLDPSSAVSTVCRAYRVSGRLDLAALRTAWQEILARHDILRTTLVEQDGRPVPRTAGEPDAELSSVDLTSGADPDSAGERWLAQLARTPLRLAEGPLARLATARLGVREHLVVLVLHRAVCDADSVPILLGELSAGYAAALESPAPQALPRPGQYATDERADSPELLDWWTARLTPPPPALSLPVDRERPAGPSSAGDSVRFEWTEAIARPLAELSAVEHSTPANVLLAAFQTLLHRYTAEERVAVGTLVPARPRNYTGVVGPFENLLVLCGDLSGRPTFRELAGRVARQATEAAEHRWLAFADLVPALRIDRDPRQVPLCQAMFAGPDVPEPVLALSGTTIATLPVHNGSARADLVLSIERVGPTVVGELEFRTSLLDRNSAARILDQLHTLLAAALAEPDRRIDELPLASPEWTDELLARTEAVAAAAPPALAAHELVHQQATLRPDAAAIAWQGAEIGYGELAGLATAIAGELTGVEGAPVVVRMPTGPRQIAASIAALDAGAYLACLGPGDAGERGRSLLAELRPACLLLEGDGADDDLAQWYRDELGGRLLDVAALGAAAPRRAVPAGPAARAYVTYTSGSTGQPKGIPQSHATLAQFVTWFSAAFGIGPGARVAQWAAPGYDASLVEMFGALVAGATLCPVPDRIRPNPERIVDWLADNEITVFQTVPSFARQLLEVITDRGDAGRLGALNHLLLAGEALPGELANQLRATLPRARLVNLYGPTESILATWHEITGPVQGTAPVGRPIPGRAVLVLDEHGRPCPAGVTGHIVIRSAYLTEGYLGAAAADRSAFQSGQGTGVTYRTGDLGRLRFDGALEFRGRKDFQVKFNGMRMELTDIEAALRAHESVADCAVVAIRKADGLVGRLVGYVVPRRDEAGNPVGTANSWRSALKNRFGKAMPPVSFQTIIGLPRTISGKVDRKALPAPGTIATPSAAPPSTVRRDLAAVWSGVLGGGAEPDPDETFFAAGGHSLLIPPLLHRIRELFEVDVPLWDFFAAPTLTGVSAFVEAHLASQSDETATTVTG